MFQEENWIVDKLVALRLPLKLFLFVLIYVNFSVIALLRRHLFCKKNVLHVFPFSSVFYLFSKICNFYSAYGNAKYLKHRIEYVKFLFIAGNKVLLLLKNKRNWKYVINLFNVKKKWRYLWNHVFGLHVGKAKMCLRVRNFQLFVLQFCKVFKWIFNHWFFVSTKKNFINHNSSRTTTNEWWAINAIWFVVERILATFFESLLHQNHVYEVFSTRVNCKLKYQYRIDVFHHYS